MYETSEQIRILRLTLRDPEQRGESVTAALACSDWPHTEPGETLFLRRLAVRGRAAGIGTLAAAQAGDMAGRAVDGADPRADRAQAVRFGSRAALLACLLADLLAGRAGTRWFWRSYSDLYVLPPVHAAIRVLAREPLELPAVAAHLAGTTAWTGLWRDFSPGDALDLLAAVQSGTGWAIAPTTGSAAPASPSGPSPHTAGPIHPDPIWAGFDDLVLPPLTAKARAGDPRLRLALVLALWQRSPQVLAGGDVAQGLAAMERSIAGESRSPLVAARGLHPTVVGMPSPAGRFGPYRERTHVHPLHGPAAAKAPARPTPGNGTATAPPGAQAHGSEPYPTGDVMGPSLHTPPVSGPTAPKNLAEQGTKAPRTGSTTRLPARADRPVRPEGPGAETARDTKDPTHQVSQVGQLATDGPPPVSKAHRPASGMPPPGPAYSLPSRESDRVEPQAPRGVAIPPREDRLATRQGGLFYLFNFLALPSVQHRLEPNAYPGLAAGWIWLHQLGMALGYRPDPPLLRFLTSQAGLGEPDAFAGLGPLPGIDDLLRLGAARCGEEVWGPSLCARPALVTATRSHLDVHYRLDDARLAVRRVGLDIDPGWLPWLGRVVSFHYRHVPELAGLDAP